MGASPSDPIRLTPDSTGRTQWAAFRGGAWKSRVARYSPHLAVRAQGLCVGGSTSSHPPQALAEHDRGFSLPETLPKCSLAFANISILRHFQEFKGQSPSSTTSIAWKCAENSLLSVFPRVSLSSLISESHLRRSAAAGLAVGETGRSSVSSEPGLPIYVWRSPVTC
jgi:hypothetical protein